MTKEDLVTENTGEKTKVYEVGYLLLPIIEESNVQTEANNIRDIIEKNDGMFISEEVPQIKGLTYPMIKVISGKKQKFEEAYFGWIKFEAKADMMKSIKDLLDKSENILRYILINTLRENTIISNSKTGRFSFDKEVDKEKGKNKKEKKEEILTTSEENKDKKGLIEEKDVDEEKIKDSGKKLDDTIDDLVIE